MPRISIILARVSFGANDHAPANANRFGVVAPSLDRGTNSRDAEQHLTSQTAGGVLTTAQAFDPLSGRVTAIQAGTGNGVANFSYTWDTASDLVQRTDGNAIAGGLSENFCYDALNRLTVCIR